jgi:outer membrane immunogenic protein
MKMQPSIANWQSRRAKAIAYAVGAFVLGIILVIAWAAYAGSAWAADLGGKPSDLGPGRASFLPVPGASLGKPTPWSGLRVYGDLGYAVQRDHAVDDDDGGSPFGTVFDITSAVDGLTYGFGAGLDGQVGDKMVAGVFADISWTNKGNGFTIPVNGSSSPIVGDIDIDHIVTVGGRLGFLATPNVLLYGLGGYSWVDANTLTSYGSGQDAVKAAFGDRGGWTVGAGVEAFLFGSRTWTGSLEYRYTDLGGHTLHWSDNPASVADVDSDLHRVIARVAYHF